MHRNRRHVWNMAALLIGLATVSKGATTIFEDRIAGYRHNRSYYLAHPGVIRSQLNGGGGFLVKTNWNTYLPGYTPEAGEEFVEVGSGSYQNYSTLAATNTVTERYGQIFFRIARPSVNAQWLRLQMSTNAAPQFAATEAGTPGAGPDIMFLGTGMRYKSGTSQYTYEGVPSGMYTVTINYDLSTHKYDVWLNDTKVVTAANFYDVNFGSTARSIAIGGAYWSVATNPILNQWYWKTDNTTAFTSQGTVLTPASPRDLEREWRADAADFVFSDRIRWYTPKDRYTNQNPRVFCPQENGGGTLRVQTNYLDWVAPAGEQFVNLLSGMQYKYSTLAVGAVGAAGTRRYGQLCARIANYHTSASTCWLRLTMANNSVPVLPDNEVAMAGAGADVFWIGKEMRYFDGTTKIGGNPYPAGFYTVTLNYDLLTRKYDIWIGSNLIERNVNFVTAAFGDTVRSMALGAAWQNSNDGGAALDQWYWRVRDDEPFVYYGQTLPLGWPPETMLIVR